VQRFGYIWYWTAHSMFILKLATNLKFLNLFPDETWLPHTHTHTHTHAGIPRFIMYMQTDRATEGNAA
jgi:hypothetical protein